MSHIEPADRLGEVVQNLLRDHGLLDEKGKATREAERRTGIARLTLDRKITSGDFTMRELFLIARVFGIKASAIAVMAEDAA